MSRTEGVADGKAYGDFSVLARRYSNAGNLSNKRIDRRVDRRQAPIADRAKDGSDGQGTHERAPAAVRPDDKGHGQGAEKIIVRCKKEPLKWLI
jgi:hypothetical protein